MKFGKIKILMVIIAVLILGAAGYGAFKFFAAKNLNAPADAKNFDVISFGSGAPAAGAPLSLSQTYANSDFNFTINYPDGFTESSFKDGAPDPDTGEQATTILFQNASTSEGFQIYVTTFNEPETTITQERILKDVPDLSIVNPEPIIVGKGNGAAGADAGGGLSFQSQTDGGMERDVWFVYKAHLYQISAPQDSENILLQAIKTMKFSR